MEITEAMVREQLRKVIDPELGVNIVDLGLIYKIEIREVQERQRVEILMTLTSPGCPLAGMFDSLVKEALEKLPNFDGEKDLEIKLTFDPPWTMEMMSEKVKAELGFD